jgi:DNA repair protein RecO (recombination protein O)
MRRPTRDTFSRLTHVPPFASDALVLRSYKLGETSKIVVLLTRERGKLRAVARGARGKRSRYQSALEPLSEVRATFYGRQGTELFRLGGCELLRSAFLAGSRGLQNALAFSYFAELLDAFCPEGQAEDDVYRLAVSVIRAAEDGQPAEVLSRYLEAWLLKLHGLYPSTSRCASCGKPLPEGDLRYHAAAHGFVCALCEPAAGPFLNPASRRLLDAIFKTAPASLEAPSLPALRPLEPFHHELISRHLERDLRSFRVLSDLQREGLS